MENWKLHFVKTSHWHFCINTVPQLNQKLNQTHRGRDSEKVMLLHSSSNLENPEKMATWLLFCKMC